MDNNSHTRQKLKNYMKRHNENTKNNSQLTREQITRVMTSGFYPPPHGTPIWAESDEAVETFHSLSQPNIPLKTMAVATSGHSGYNLTPPTMAVATSGHNGYNLSQSGGKPNPDLLQRMPILSSGHNGYNLKQTGGNPDMLVRMPIPTSGHNGYNFTQQGDIISYMAVSSSSHNGYNMNNVTGLETFVPYMDISDQKHRNRMTSCELTGTCSPKSNDNYVEACSTCPSQTGGDHQTNKRINFDEIDGFSLPMGGASLNECFNSQVRIDQEKGLYGSCNSCKPSRK